MPPSLWFTGNLIWILTIAATVGLVIWFATYRRRNKRD